MIIATYAAILGVIFFVLSVRTIRARQSAGVALGDGGHTTVARAARVHANFAEYVPFVLILIGLVELQGARSWLVHALCVLLVLGRLVHAYGVSQARENLKFRVSGMLMTFTALLTSSGYLLYVTVVG